MAPSPTEPNPLYTLDWEAYNCDVPSVPPPGWRGDYAKEVDHDPAFRVACAPEPTRSGQRSARFQLNKGDPVVSSGIRSELAASPCCEPANAERWYGFSIYLPEEWISDDSRESVAQWKQDDTLGDQLPRPFWGSPPAALITWEGKW